MYTPTVGTAIQRYSHEYRRSRGVYLSVDAPQDIERSLRASGLGPEDVDLLVATDGEAILGIGDWGVGGMDICIGKLAVYTAAAGIDPARALPVVWTPVPTARNSWTTRSTWATVIRAWTARSTTPSSPSTSPPSAGSSPTRCCTGRTSGPATPGASSTVTATRRCTFNDDIQGTGAVNLAAVLSGARVTGAPLRDHRIVIFGAGSAGLGIADQLRDALIADGLDPQEASDRFWCIDRYGLITDDAEGLDHHRRRYARRAADVADWHRDEQVGGIALAEVVRRAQPTILIGTSGQGGAFTEEIVREMAAHTERPVILPMSNPTPLAEAKPEDLVRWTGGRALIATGSPFAPVPTTGSPTSSGRPTTPWSSRVSASARSSRTPPGSPTACCSPPPSGSPRRDSGTAGARSPAGRPVARDLRRGRRCRRPGRRARRGGPDAHRRRSARPHGPRGHVEPGLPPDPAGLTTRTHRLN